MLQKPEAEPWPQGFEGLKQQTVSLAWKCLGNAGEGQIWKRVAPAVQGEPRDPTETLRTVDEAMVALI